MVNEVKMLKLNSAGGRSRTVTRLPSLDFESSASTNSTTSASYFSRGYGFTQIHLSKFLSKSVNQTERHYTRIFCSCIKGFWQTVGNFNPFRQHVAIP